ncbi:OB-fold-containig protein [Rubripirellula reticaptiva]|uniref:OB-fold-containig protein n=1 Tax=Rubripirellula reticaptiva TaxID=2528013 RepID=UPI0011B4E50F|nr:OB-fold-containig protein [Rubripirellula reticaptiva]
MSESLLELADRMFVGPVWPASILVGLLVIYTLLALIGMIDLGMDLPDLDLDVDVDVPDAGGVDVDADFLHGLGATTIRWTNIARVPVILWGGIFAVVFWSLSYGLWHAFDVARYQPNWIPSMMLSIRNFVIAVGITKAATQPLVGYFVDPPTYDQTRLIGATCEISTSEATPEFGQAKFRTNAAPLLLNIRTDGPHIARGTEVRIVSYDPKTRIYKVTHLPTETQS